MRFLSSFALLKGEKLIFAANCSAADAIKPIPSAPRPPGSPILGPGRLTDKQKALLLSLGLGGLGLLRLGFLGLAVLGGGRRLLLGTVRLGLALGLLRLGLFLGFRRRSRGGRGGIGEGLAL